MGDKSGKYRPLENIGKVAFAGKKRKKMLQADLTL